MKNRHCTTICLKTIPGLCLAAALCFSLSLFMPGAAQAHRVLLFAWVEGGMVHVEGGFGGDRSAKGCVVKAFDHQQKLVFSGETDDKGLLSFAVPLGHKGEMVLEMEAGPGHKGSWTIGADEFEAATSTPAAQVAEHHEVMEKGADPLKIMVGLGIIFGLALGVGMLKKKRSSHA